MNVGRALRKVREQYGMTQEQFAYKIDVKRTTYVSYETSKTMPGFPVINKVIEVFGFSFFDYLEEEPGPTMTTMRSRETYYDSGLKRDDTPLSSEEKLLVKYFRSLSADEKASFYESVKKDFLDKICGFPDE